MVATGTLMIPQQVPGPETEDMTGQIVGEITYPANRGDGTFFDSHSQITIPVRLRLISEVGYQQMIIRQGNTQLFFGLGVFVMEGVLLFFMFRFVIKYRRSKGY
jgi:hypothetical protein